MISNVGDDLHGMPGKFNRPDSSPTQKERPAVTSTVGAFLRRDALIYSAAMLNFTGS